MVLGFIEYLTVFRSRVAVANVILPIATLNATRPATLLRKVGEELSRRIEVDVNASSNAELVGYLREKKLVGATPRRSGRYRGVSLIEDGGGWSVKDSSGRVSSSLRMFQTDIWFSDPRVRSTVGLPTADNAQEYLDLCGEIGLISSFKAARTTSGQTMLALRSLSPVEVENPFVMGLERAVAVRQLLEADGLMLFELMRILDTQSQQFRRDDLIPDGVIAMVVSAQQSLRDLKAKPDAIASLRALEKLLRRTADASASRKRATPKASAGPGVLEHRIAARLEWLTDLGLLMKEGLPRNGFTYKKAATLPSAVTELERGVSGTASVDDISLWIARQDPDWQSSHHLVRVDSTREALRRAYEAVQVRIGPVSIREVCFIAAVLLDEPRPVADLRGDLLAYAASSANVKLAGDRYRRDPQTIRIDGEFPA